MEHSDEKKLLAYLLKDTKYIVKVLNQMTKQHLPNVYYTYGTICAYFKKYQGIITLDYLNAFFERKNVDSAMRTKALNDFNDALHFDTSNFSDSEFDSLVDLINDTYRRKLLLNLAEQIVEKNVNICSDKEFDKLQTLMQQTLLDISQRSDNVNDEGSIKDNIQERADRYEAIKHNPDMTVTYKTGFKKIDDGSGGFAPGELIYIIGRQGAGKSVLMLNFGHNFWKQNLNVMLFSIEINKNDYTRRFEACAAGISSNGIKRGTLSDIEEKAYNDYRQKLADGLSIDGKSVGDFYIVDVPFNCTPAFIENKIEEIESQKGITYQVIIADYAGIMQPNITFGELRHNKAEIALELKQMARKLNKVVISGEQMNRVGKNQKKVENDAVAESDAVTNHIDWGIALRANTDQDTITVETFKTRDTAPLEFVCRKKFDKMQLEELQDIQEWDL